MGFGGSKRIWGLRIRGDLRFCVYRIGHPRCLVEILFVCGAFWLFRDFVFSSGFLISEFFLIVFFGIYD